jgi:hypothetical protein
LYKQTGRLVFLFSSVFVAALCGVALYLLRAHAGSHRAMAAVGYGFVILGVFWLRSLESRLMDTGAPRWCFWPYFLVVFTGCLAAYGLKVTNGPETLGLFLILQLPLASWPGKRAEARSLRESGRFPALRPTKDSRGVTPLGAFEFAVYVVLTAGLWYVLHLLRGDVSGMAMARNFRYALDAGSGLICVLWIFSVRGRLKALGRTRWTLVFCSIVLILCSLLFALRVISFPHALLLFLALQIPAVLIRRESIPARFLPVDTDF